MNSKANFFAPEINEYAIRLFIGSNLSLPAVTFYPSQFGAVLAMIGNCCRQAHSFQFFNLFAPILGGVAASKTMTAFFITVSIGALIAQGAKIFSWILGGCLIILTLVVAMVFGGITPQTLSNASLALLGYNLGLMTVFIDLFDRPVST